jgi:hypothetical protein
MTGSVPCSIVDYFEMLTLDLSKSEDFDDLTKIHSGFSFHSDEVSTLH